MSSVVFPAPRKPVSTVTGASAPEEDVAFAGVAVASCVADMVVVSVTLFARKVAVRRRVAEEI
ncbi:hypothetical protein ANI02nite_30580 [Acetobacter nitrogenifigens DSM 23921 = NBRC 105050]|uniref:Uncharacterized protein n=1 Tax=Acetobacter nitrogenifigens DSM 23921 = NBRC 105050 TaxID=1120919 RepID=A0A511XDY2_9PROT|nr:hypothetical protein ANI02nite_30580 [Acetobacter nitrogenifigens DSM 23921 = NBRC 105050]